MTGFASFPNELIAEVWRHVRDPESVENFALASKRIYALGRRFVVEHNELKAEFSSVTHYHYGLGIGPSESFKTPLQNSHAALYVRTISIQGWESEWGEPNGYEEADHRPYREDTMNLFRKPIKNSLLSLEEEIVSRLDTFETRYESAVFSLILTMFPNVRSLNLHHIYSNEQVLFATIKRIAESHNTEFVSRLTDVRLLFGDIKDRKNFDWVRTFATLSSVRAIEVWDIGPDYDCSNHNYPNDVCIGESCKSDNNSDYYHAGLLPTSSAVTRLTFINCVINIKKLLSFLEGLQELTSFQYHSPCEFLEPVKMVDALLAKGKHTLRKLRLRSGGERMDYAVTLADFKLLEELEIGYDFLQDIEGTNKVADMLPRSIQSVHLSRLYTNCHSSMNDDVLEMCRGKTKLLPNLKDLTIEVNEIDKLLYEESGPLCQKCTAVGIELTVTAIPPGTRDWSLSDWMRNEWCERRKSGYGFSDQEDNRSYCSWTEDMFPRPEESLW